MAGTPVDITETSEAAILRFVALVAVRLDAIDSKLDAIHALLQEQ